jgi:hypothetical protein
MQCTPSDAKNVIASFSDTLGTFSVKKKTDRQVSVLILGAIS